MNACAHSRKRAQWKKNTRVFRILNAISVITLSGVANQWRNMDVGLPHLPRDYHHGVSQKYGSAIEISEKCTIKPSVKSKAIIYAYPHTKMEPDD